MQLMSVMMQKKHNTPITPRNREEPNYFLKNIEIEYL